MPSRRKGKNPVQPIPSQGGDSEPDGGDHSGLLLAMNKMMKNFLGELSGVLKNNQWSTVARVRGSTTPNLENGHGNKWGLVTVMNNMVTV